jgi:tetratricopeptide (TPR) repeat protein
MKKNWIFLTGLLSLVGTLQSANRAASLQEGIELRRISEYCKEKNYHAVKSQIHGFLSKHPHSESADALHAMLGDIFFSEGDFQSALTAYDQIQKEEFKTRTEFRRIHSLHQLAQFEKVIAATGALLKNEKSAHPELPTLRMQLANALFRQSLAAEDRENKLKLLHLAKEQFKLLVNSEYADQTIAPLAHIYAFLKEYPQAVKMYQLLVEKDEKNKEEFLLQALQLQLKFDRSAAIETCQKIYALNGTAAPQAAFNQLSLLFQEKRYRDIALFQDKTLKHISPEHLPLAHYYIGRSLHHIGDFAQAAANLEKFLSKSTDDALRVKNGLLTLLVCAKEIDDLALFEKTLSHIKSAFPKDPETIKATLLHTQLCRSKGQIEKAACDLKDLLDTFPDLPEKDNILYDYALLLSQQEQWMDSGLAFEAFLKQFPAHPQHKNGWRNLVHCHFKAAAGASPETSFVKKEQLCGALNRALKEKGLFSPEERKKMRFCLAAAWYEIHKYDNCLGELAEFLKDYSNDAQIGEAYVLTALSHYNGTKDLDLFTSYAEKALSHQPSLPEASKLHLNLFNTYLTLAGVKNTQEKSDMLLKAADHLYQVLDHPLKKENQLWLADFYFHQYKESGPQQSPLFLDRSIAVLEKILNFTPQNPSLAITADKIEMEAEAIKLAELYSDKKKNQQRIDVLLALTEGYKGHPDFAWKYQRLAHFELATAFKEEKQFDRALSAYTFLIESSSHATSYFSLAAQLDKTLLEFSLLDAAAKKEDAPQMQAICDALKDLEIKRKLFSEPCHLEAALSYIDITASLSTAEQQADRRLLLLDQLKFSFSCLDDPLVVQYLSTKGEFPEKHELYQQYMELISAEILGSQAAKANRSGDKDQCLSLSDKAIDKLFVLSSQASHPRLKERVEKSREALKQIL